MLRDQALHYTTQRPRSAAPWLAASLAFCAVAIVLCVLYVILSELNRRTWNWEVLGGAALLWKLSPVHGVPYLLWLSPAGATFFLAIATCRRTYRRLGPWFVLTVIAIIVSYGGAFVASEIRSAIDWSTLAEGR